MLHLVSALSRSRTVRRAVRGFRLHSLGNAWLRRFPVIKRLPGSGIAYRATRLESIPLAVEIFERGNLYNIDMLPQEFSTFCDLGCNVGYFTCWLAHIARGRELKGLMVDANPAVVEEARWHIDVNQWREVHAFHGIVGEECPGGYAEFFTYESNICSASQVPSDLSNLNGKWQRIRVPCLSVGKLWRKNLGSERCHVLKVDVEGSELQFVRSERDFMLLVDTVIVEWHKWRVSFDELKGELLSQGFELKIILEENAEMGTAVFTR